MTTSVGSGRTALPRRLARSTVALRAGAIGEDAGAIQPGDLERAQHVAGWADERQPAMVAVERLSRLGEQLEAASVDQANVCEVDPDVALGGVQDGFDGAAQRAKRRDVDVTGHADDRAVADAGGADAQRSPPPLRLSRN